MSYYVYILTNRTRTLYIGYTNDLPRRLFEHKLKLVKGFTQKYSITNLVYYEIYDDQKVAEKREKQIKGWLRAKKVDIIESMNPDWKDLGFRFIYPEEKAAQLLCKFKNKNLDGTQILHLLYGTRQQEK